MTLTSCRRAWRTTAPCRSSREGAPACNFCACVRCCCRACHIPTRAPHSDACATVRCVCLHWGEFVPGCTGGAPGGVHGEGADGVARPPVTQQRRLPPPPVRPCLCLRPRVCDSVTQQRRAHPCLRLPPPLLPPMQHLLDEPREPGV
eukprot:280664-Chlamydomonas_euryale.AAC.1